MPENLPTGYSRDPNGNIVSSNGQGLQSPFEQQMYNNALSNQATSDRQQQWGDMNASMMSNPQGWGSSMANLAQSQGAAAGYNSQWQPFQQSLIDSGGKIDTTSLAAGMNTTGSNLPPPAIRGLKSAGPPTPPNAVDQSTPPSAPPFPVPSGTPGGVFAAKVATGAPDLGDAGPLAGLQAAIPPKPQGSGGGMTAR